MPPVKGSKPRMEKYKLGINLFDIDSLSEATRVKFLKGRLDLTKPVHAELDRIEPTMALVFCCDLLTAATVLDMIRSECRRLGSPVLVRGYINRGGDTWARLLNRQVLTVLGEDKKPKLNPDIFPEAEVVEIAPVSPPKRKRVMMYPSDTANGEQ